MEQNTKKVMELLLELEEAYRRYEKANAKIADYSCAAKFEGMAEAFRFVRNLIDSDLVEKELARYQKENALFEGKK